MQILFLLSYGLNRIQEKRIVVNDAWIEKSFNRCCAVWHMTRYKRTVDAWPSTWTYEYMTRLSGFIVFENIRSDVTASVDKSVIGCSTRFYFELHETDK